MTRPVCTHPCHLDPAVYSAQSDIVWTCPRCREMVTVAVVPVPVVIPGVVTP